MNATSARRRAARRVRDPAAALRHVRLTLSAGGLTAAERRTPEGSVRLATIHACREIEHIIDQLRRRIDAGERCRVVCTEKGRRLGLAIVHLEIVPVPAETPRDG
jgi:hypothetical protein